METLQAIAGFIARRWTTRLIYYAILFWSLDTILAHVIPWQKPEGVRILTALVFACVLTLLETYQPAANTEGRSKRRSAGLIVVLVLAVAAVIMTVFDLH
jgi:hypothetical protein